MLILSLFFAILVIQTSKDVLEKGVSIYQSPRFWTQFLTMMLIAYVTTLA